MHKLFKALAVSGLAICAGPLSLETMAQGYIDLESERAATGSSTSSQADTRSAPVETSPPPTASPYSAPDNTSASPARSYGLDSSSAPATTLSAPPTTGGSGGVGGTQNLGNLFYQLQQLQQEVMMLNGKVEEQAHELRSLREQNLERYVDVDRRLSEIGSGATSASAGNGKANGNGSISGAAIAGSSSAAEQPGEGDAYRSAYALVRGQQFNDAIDAFKGFLARYPAGKYAPNAHYWLGELYLVITPPDLESSRQAFMLLLEEYPDNSKIPDALYKLGKVQYLKGNRDRAKEFFDRVISEYGSSNSSAVNLAREFLRENY
ncbi:MAG: tol-pal system protein YbgF [Halioglobus sp.]